MKKYTIPLTLCAVVLAAGAFAVADHHLAGEKPAGDKIDFFDVEKCAICKCMGEHKDLMSEVKWETHIIENGMLMMAVVPEHLKEKMNDCCKEMEETAMKVMSGQKEGQICGFCEGYGKLIAAGANQQEIETAVGRITLLTSDDAETVRKIQEHGKEAQKAAKKMEEEMTKVGSTN